MDEIIKRECFFQMLNWILKLMRRIIPYYQDFFERQLSWAPL